MLSVTGISYILVLFFNLVGSDTDILKKKGKDHDKWSLFLISITVDYLLFQI